ncbi:uncharacterized protein LOC123505635 [Portunus trituberculatus]|uniref:uncharacterized protein LOC123505635 n=1 Tax=Portunus trituberculatus TaxID=210409 RepID=UPI001E1D2032|nr:uncharacterized protein LOC123505635 [Portunus trituberculatus]
MASPGLPVLAIHITIGFLNGVCGDLLANVEVPRVALAGGRVNVSCSYDLRDTGLYSLKWYHNDTEFYRYVPTETHRPVDIKPTVKFQAHEIARTETGVTLSLTSMTSDATGDYKCEVIAEHPSFRTEANGSFMTVLDEPLTPPVIEGAQDMYEGDEKVALWCVPAYIPQAGPLPSLSWYLGNAPARGEYVSPYREDSQEQITGLYLQMPPSQVWKSGSSVEAMCELKLDSQIVRTSKILRVRARHSSYLFDYSTAGTAHPCVSLLVVALLLSFRLHS